MKIVIDLAELPVRELAKCRGELLQMLEEFNERHPEICIPGSAIRIEGSIFGANIAKSIL